MKPGERLFLYTDGVVEAGAPDNALDVSGLTRLLEQTSDYEVSRQVNEVIAAVEARSGKGLVDDVTLLGFRVLPGDGERV
jgi:serine phosphatase RsbU (regulator of sigma subunit)